MRVIAVLDLAGGHAVHAHGGQRDRYRAVQTVAGKPIPSGDALALAHAYVDLLHIGELYAADLDAISGQMPQDALVAQLASLAVLWLDGGVSSPERADDLLARGAAHVVIGLETLPSFTVLRDISDAIGPGRLAFSLDLRNGEPIVNPEGAGSTGQSSEAHVVAARAADAGVGSILVIDLARVGARRGLDFGLISRVRQAVPDLTLVAGGGVRGPRDLIRLAAAGCDAALVATALHNGRLDRRQIAQFKQLRTAPPTTKSQLQYRSLDLENPEEL